MLGMMPPCQQKRSQFTTDFSNLTPSVDIKSQSKEPWVLYPGAANTNHTYIITSDGSSNTYGGVSVVASSSGDTAKPHIKWPLVSNTSMTRPNILAKIQMVVTPAFDSSIDMTYFEITSLRDFAGNSAITAIRSVFSTGNNVQIWAADATSPSVTSAFTISNTTKYWVRTDYNGSNLQMKVWADGAAEPSTYTYTAASSRFDGSIGMLAATGNATSFATTKIFWYSVANNAMAPYPVG